MYHDFYSCITISIHVSRFLFMYHDFYSCITISIHVSRFLFMYHDFYSCITISIHVSRFLFMYHDFYSCITISIHSLLFMYSSIYSIKHKILSHVLAMATGSLFLVGLYYYLYELKHFDVLVHVAF